MTPKNNRLTISTFDHIRPSFGKAAEPFGHEVLKMQKLVENLEGEVEHIDYQGYIVNEQHDSIHDISYDFDDDKKSYLDE